MFSLKKHWLALAFTGAIALGSAGTVFAATSPAPDVVSIALTSADASAMTGVITQTAQNLNGSVTTYVPVVPDPQKLQVSGGVQPAKDTELLYMGASNTLEFNVTAWQDATSQSQTAALTDFIKAMQQSSVSQQGQQDVINQMEAQDNSIQQMLIPIIMQGTSANLYTAMRVVAPFLPAVNLILGIGAFAIMLFLMLSTVVDLSFIGLPIFRESINRRSDDRNGGGTRIPFVSHDAVSVVNETELDVGSAGGYKNVYLLYFKRRVITYIILSICILYLVVGELGGVVAWLLHMVNGTLASSSN